MQATGGATPLMYACQQCRETEVLEILKRQPYSVKERDRTLKTPLHYCAENPNSSCAEAVLKLAPELVNAQDENGYCPLHLAVIAGNKPLVKLLVAKGADVNVQDNEGHSPVHWAIVSSEREALETVVRGGADPSTPDIHGGYPLHYAVQMCGCNCDYVRNLEDTVRVVEALLNFGVDVGVKDKDGRQPILWAASAGSADAIIHLVSAGACVEAADKDGLTALHCAASRGHTTALETLITLCGANVDVIDGNGCSALFYAVTLGHADATELLLRLGADPNRQDRKGRTPAHCGAAKGQLETLRILQKHGGNLWMRNVKGDIPLHEAVASGRKDLVLWLLSQCPEAINLANNDGRCPLHIASMYNNTEMVKVLLDCKSLVNPVMRTSKGVLMTPLNVALSKGHRSCGKYLQLHGGVPFSKVSKVEPASGFALRVSPSDDAVIVGENDKENLTPTQIKITKSRGSTDVQENREIVKTESSDKKKVYRRRKKKKNTSSIHTQDSDSDDSVHDLKIKTPDSRKSERSNEEPDDGNKKVRLDGRKTEKSPNSSAVESKTGSPGRTEVNEEVKKTESKSLQRNKSFNETKNVSDLSPEDFPPLMQTIEHLDIVIMEPNIEASKSESESASKQQQNAVVVDATPEEDGLPIVDGLNAYEKAGKEEEIQENPGKAPKEVKKPNGSKEGRKSSEEGSGRKTVRSPKSSSDGKKDSKTGKKSNGGLEGRRKTASPKTPEQTEEKTEKPEAKPSDEVQLEEKPKTEEKPLPEEKPEIVLDEITKTQTAVVETLAETNAQVKTPEDAAISGSAAEAVKVSPEKEEVKPSETQEKEVHPFVVVEADVYTPENGSAAIEAPEKSTEPVESVDEPGEKPAETSVPEPATLANAVGAAEISSTMVVEEPVKENFLPVTEKQPAEISQIVNAEPEEKKPTDVKRSQNGDPKHAGNDNKTSVNISSGKDDNIGSSESKEVINAGSSEQKEDINSSRRNSKEAVDAVDSSNSKEAITASLKNGKESVNDSNNNENKKEVLSAGTSSKQHLNPGNGNIAEPSSSSKDLTDISIKKGEEEAITAPNETENEEMRRTGEKTSERDPDQDESRGEKKGEDRQFRTPRVSRLCRRNRDFKDDMNQVSVTQLVQNTIRKYHMERGIFYQLLELKRYQIRSGKANEQVLVKRLADEYERSRVFLGMKPFTGLYKFKEFEKFLYDQLKALNSRRSYIIPEVKSYDDIDALSGFLKKSRYKIISETPPPEMVCTCITQRCHHSACAYTNVPCSAYITDLRRFKHPRPKREAFFPRIETQKPKERPATLELVQGSEKHVITLPQNSPGGQKRYYVTFTIKGAPAYKEDDVGDDSKDYFKHRHAKSV